VYSNFWRYWQKLVLSSCTSIFILYLYNNICPVTTNPNCVTDNQYKLCSMFCICYPFRSRECTILIDDIVVQRCHHCSKAQTAIAKSINAKRQYRELVFNEPAKRMCLHKVLPSRLKATLTMEKKRYSMLPFTNIAWRWPFVEVKRLNCCQKCEKAMGCIMMRNM